MTEFFTYFANQPVLLAFFLMGVGMFFGHFKVKGISLGAAAVLFVAIAFAAVGQAHGVEVRVPHEVGIAGLVLFAFAIGNNSGPSFFANIRKAIGPMIAMVGIFIASAGVALALGRFVFDMDIALIAGTWAGSVTNTPALAAAGEASGNESLATIGYSISYLFGVVGMMLAAFVALRRAGNDTDKPEPVTHANLRVDRSDNPRLSDIAGLLLKPVEFSRLRRGETGPIWIPTPEDRIEQGDLLTVVGTQDQLDTITALIGHRSSHSLRADRRHLDFRRITISNPDIAGKTIEEIDEVLAEKWGAYASRVRRGDTDMLALPKFMVEMGDRVRVIAPTNNMREVSRYFGDSAKGLSDINPVALGLGLALGIALGTIVIPIPGGGFAIGAAAGSLIIGLLFGRIGRIGKQVLALPNTTCSVLSELGLLLFLAQAGTNAGGQIAEAFTSGMWVSIFLLGAAITTVVAVGTYVMMRSVFRMGGTQLSGLLGGTQTQPAVLAFVNSRTNADPRVALGYALVYPMAMIAKIIVATVIGSF